MISQLPFLYDLLFNLVNYMLSLGIIFFIINIPFFFWCSLFFYNSVFFHAYIYINFLYVFTLLVFYSSYKVQTCLVFLFMKNHFFFLPSVQEKSNLVFLYISVAWSYSLSYSLAWSYSLFWGAPSNYYISRSKP